MHKHCHAKQTASGIRIVTMGKLSIRTASEIRMITKETHGIPTASEIRMEATEPTITLTVSETLTIIKETRGIPIALATRMGATARIAILITSATRIATDQSPRPTLITVRSSIASQIMRREDPGEPREFLPLPQARY